MYAWHIRDEGIYSLEKGFTKYTSNAGMKSLRQTISGYMRRRFDLSYDPDNQILVTVGGSEAIDLALRTLIEPGDEVIIPVPSFVCYEPLTLMAGGMPVLLKQRRRPVSSLRRSCSDGAITPKPSFWCCRILQSDRRDHVKEDTEACGDSKGYKKTVLSEKLR